MLLILLLAMGMFVFTFWLARQTLARDSGPKEMTFARSPPLPRSSPPLQGPGPTEPLPLPHAGR